MKFAAVQLWGGASGLSVVFFGGVFAYLGNGHLPRGKVPTEVER